MKGSRAYFLSKKTHCILFIPKFLPEARISLQ